VSQTRRTGIRKGEVLKTGRLTNGKENRLAKKRNKENGAIADFRAAAA